MPRKSVEKYIEEIQDIHNSLQLYPDSETLQKRMYNKLRSFANRIEADVLVAQNEQLPYTSEELGLPTRPMLLKASSGQDQVGDYQAFIDSLKIWYPVLVERKTLNDLYGTLIDEERRARFYREFDRFLEDDRFTEFRLYAECSRLEFMAYFPPWPRVCKYCAHCQKVQRKQTYWCCVSNADEPDAQVQPVDTCSSYRKKIRTDADVRKLIKKKRTILSRLEAKGVHVCWMGSRKEATLAYQIDLRQWVVENYVTLLKLDEKPYDDIEHLKTKKAMLEAELSYVNDSLNSSLYTEEAAQ